MIHHSVHKKIQTSFSKHDCYQMCVPFFFIEYKELITTFFSQQLKESSQALDQSYEIIAQGLDRFAKSGGQALLLTSTFRDPQVTSVFFFSSDSCS
jgi:hypothetical protein